MRLCGILGYIGTTDGREAILTGLERLEYRGYDSAGVAVLNEQGLSIFKKEGLTTGLRKTDFMKQDAPLAIAHTRWATRGCVALHNAHPHHSSSGRFTLVHNGSIENETKIRKRLLQNYPFTSETDTEVIVALIEKYEAEFNNLENALLHLLTILKGSYTFILIDKFDKDTLYAVKNKAPLVIGLSDDFKMVASDVASMSHMTDKFIVTANQELVKLTKNSVKVFDRYGRDVTKIHMTINVNEDGFDKGDYPHHVLQEIDEQPQILQKYVDEFLTSGWPKNKLNAIGALKNADRIYLVGGGTSLNSSLVGKKVIEQVAGIPVEVLLASELCNEIPLLSKKPVFIILSTSGESVDGRNSLFKVRDLGFHTILITNTHGSALSREADFTLYLDVGIEMAISATKTYIAQVALFILIAFKLAKKVDIDLKKEFENVINVTRDLLSKKNDFEALAGEYLSRDYVHVVGRSYDQATAYEASLKLKEMAYINASGLVGGELKYGNLALFDIDTPIIGIVSNKHTRGSIQVAKVRKPKLLIVSLASVSYKTDQIVVGDVHPILAPLVMIVPLQLLAYYAGISRSINVDRPRHLAKL